MEIQTIRLITISAALSSLLFDAENDINDNFGMGSLVCPFIQSYESYLKDYVVWKKDVDVLSLDISSFEEEVRENFLQMDEVKRLNYVRFLNNRINPLTEKAKNIKLKLTDLREKISRGEINGKEPIDDSGYNIRTINNFVSYLNNTLNTIQDVEFVYIRYVGVFHYSALRPLKDSSQQLQPEQSKPVEPGIKLQWNGTNRVLYDLFAQLTLIDVAPGKRMIGNTIKDLARFLSDNVEGFPKAETIERELEKMREPQGIEKAKRGRIDLNFSRDKDL